MREKWLLTVFGTLLMLSACAVPRHPAPRYYDATNPLKRVAVLPMKNDTDDVEGPALVRKRMVEALVNKSYIIKDMKETDQTLRDRMGINLGGQLEMTTPQKLAEVLGVEGLLYGTLIDFGETNLGVLSVRKVRAKFKLVDAQSGGVFWEKGLGVRAETRMSGRTANVAGALARGSDAREKDIPWVTINSVSTNERNIGQAFAVNLGVKLLTKAMGVHLDHETREMVRRVTTNLPWGPGPGSISAVSVAAPIVNTPQTAH